MAKKKEVKPNFIVSFFLFLARSKKYNNVKKQVNALLNDEKNLYKRYLDYLLIFLIVTSVAIFIYEVKHKIPYWLEFYAVYFTSAIFAIEYLANLWLYHDVSKDFEKEYNESNFLGRKTKYFKVFIISLTKKIKYIFTPIAIIDLLAILPAYRPLRVLRIFVLFRFLKIIKYSRSMHHFATVLADRKFELITLFALLIFIVFVGGLAIYSAEEHLNNKINSLFDGLYWSFITITTVGFGDITPVTGIGKVISFAIVILGITLISFATSIIVSAFSDKLNELKEDRAVEEISNRNKFTIICGYGQISKVFLQHYDKDNYIILDTNQKKVNEAISDGHKAICDNAGRYKVLSKFYNENSKITVLALTGSDIENIYITLNAKSISKNIEVIARTSSYKIYDKYKRAGADRIILPNEIASSMMVASIIYPTMYKAVNAILHRKDIVNLDEMYVSEDCKLIDKSIEEIDLAKYKIILFGVQNGVNGSFRFNPPKDYIFKENDLAIVVGHKMSIKYFKSLFNVGSYR